jgi:sulfur-oxidizing protein SoxY
LHQEVEMALIGDGPTRRRFMGGAGAALAGGIAGPALARLQDVEYEIRQALDGAAPLVDKVLVDLPRHSDAGTSVPLTLSVDSPMSADNFVEELFAFASENPRPRLIAAWFTPACGRAEISTRIRLEGAQTVSAVAKTSDGGLWRGDAPVGVTFGACADVGEGPGTDSSFVPQIRVSAPASAMKGEIVSIRTIITHPMETGLRLGNFNQYIPLRIIERFIVRSNGAEVLRVRLEPAISTNPYLAFPLLASETTTLEFEWLDTTGAIYTRTTEMVVS